MSGQFHAPAAILAPEPVWTTRGREKSCLCRESNPVSAAIPSELFRPPLYSQPYFTVTNLRLPFLSPPTIRRVTLEVFDRASTQVVWFQSESESEAHYDWRSVSLSVLVSSPVWGSWPDISYCLTVTVLPVGRAPSLTRGRVCHVLG
jgi:hypothetical protein